MMTSTVSAMQNIMGSFVQNIYLGKTASCIDLFSENPDVMLHLPDQDRTLVGNTQIRQYFKELDADEKSGSRYREIHVLNTPAFKADTEEMRGSWDSFVYRCGLGDDPLSVEPAFCRFDCDFDKDADGNLKIMRMDWYQLLDWEPWKLQSIRPIAETTAGIPVSADVINDQDFTEMERVLAKGLHSDGWDPDSPDIAKSDETQGKILFCAMYAVNPVIVKVSESEGFGRWIGMRSDVCEAPDGTQTAVRNTGLLNVRFIRENLSWKIKETSYIVGETFSPVKLISPFNREMWRPICQESSLPEDPMDVFEIQSLMGQWTSRLKTGRLNEYPVMFMTEKKDDMFLWLGPDVKRQKFGFDAFLQDMYRMDNNRAKAPYRTPIIHTAMTPYIVFSEDGSYAWGQWLDQCYTDTSQMTGDGTPPLPAMMNLCKYQNEYRKENGTWKMVKLTWNAWCSMEYIFTDPRKWKGWVSEKYDNVPWPMPLERYQA